MIHIRLNTDDKSSHNELPKLRSREKAQSGVLKTANGTNTRSGETNLSVTTCTITVYLHVINMLNTDDESSRNELLMPRSREKAQSGVPKAAKVTKTQSGETDYSYLYY